MPNFNFEFVVDSPMGDICRHQRIAQRVQSTGLRFDLYFFANDGAKPVQINANGQWIDDFAALFADNVVLAGPTISCQAKVPHVQTHFFALNPKGLRFLDEIQCQSEEGLYQREVLLSANVLKGGGQIASLLSNYRRASFSIPEWANLSLSSDLRQYQNSPLPPPCAGFANPSICFEGDPGKLHWLKWGGTLEDYNLMPKCSFSSSPGLSKCSPALAPGESREGNVCDTYFRL
uniref:Uncharacterized protein n=1 Tax=Lotharella oceanica TaxID=641309 RepID=A0A7S2TK13_9EUKA